MEMDTKRKRSCEWKILFEYVLSMGRFSTETGKWDLWTGRARSFGEYVILHSPPGPTPLWCVLSKPKMTANSKLWIT